MTVASALLAGCGTAADIAGDVPAPRPPTSRSHVVPKPPPDRGRQVDAVNIVPGFEDETGQFFGDHVVASTVTRLPTLGYDWPGDNAVITLSFEDGAWRTRALVIVEDGIKLDKESPLLAMGVPKFPNPFAGDFKPHIDVLESLTVPYDTWHIPRDGHGFTVRTLQLGSHELPEGVEPTDALMVNGWGVTTRKDGFEFLGPVGYAVERTPTRQPDQSAPSEIGLA